MAVQKASNSEKPKSAENDQNSSANQEDHHIPEGPHLRPIAASTELTTDEVRNLIESLLEEKSSLEAELVLATEAALVSELQNDLIVVFLEAQISTATEKSEKFLESLERSRPSCGEVCLEEKTRLGEENELLEANVRKLQLFKSEALKESKAAMSKEKKGLQAKILDLEKKLAEKEDSIAKLQLLTKEATDKWMYMAFHRGDTVTALKQEMKSAEKAKEHKTFEIINLKAELSRFRSAYEKQLDRNSKLVSKIARISDAADEEARDNEEIKTELRSEASWITDERNKELRVLRQCVREFEEKNKELVSKVARIRDSTVEEVRVLHESASVLRESVRVLHKRAREYEERNNELVSENARIRNSTAEELTTKKEAVSVAKNRLDEELEKVKGLNQEVENMEKQIAELKKQHQDDVQTIQIKTKKAVLQSLEETANVILPSRSNNYAKKTLDEKISVLLTAFQDAFKAKQNENKALKESEAAAKKWKSWSMVLLATVVLLIGVVSFLFLDYN